VPMLAVTLFLEKLVVPRQKIWIPRPMSLFPVHPNCSPSTLIVPRQVFGFPVRLIYPSKLHQIT
jgi:hypothetical protein